MTKITIVIPNYNGLRYIDPCLKALYNQEPDTPEYTVIVIDNGSTDGSTELIEKSFPQVQLVKLPENTGFCHAVNLGIQASRTPYVLLLNNDTKVKAAFIKSLYQAIISAENIFSVSAKMLMWDKPELIDDAGDQYCVLGWAYSRGKGRDVTSGKGSTYRRPASIFSACGGAALYRKSIMEEIGLFDENHFAYLEDLDIGYRAQIHGYRNLYEPTAEVLHFGSASTGSRYNEWKTVMAAANSVYVIYKNMPLLQILLNSPFLLLGFIIKHLFFCKKGMGKQYRKGILEGLKKCSSKSGRDHKVPFLLRNLPSYIKIQLLLYKNTIGIIMKS